MGSTYLGQTPAISSGTLGSESRRSSEPPRRLLREKSFLSSRGNIGGGLEM